MRKATTDVNALNTVVLSGLKLKDLDSKTTGEIDFLIISLLLQSIIHIEVKRANTDSTRSSAWTQLTRGLAFFEENIPFPSSENWNYTKMMCFGESVAKDICDDCKPFVLSANFIEMNMTQPVAKQIADQFKSFWKGSKVCQGIKNIYIVNCKKDFFIHNWF